MTRQEVVQGAAEQLLALDESSVIDALSALTKKMQRLDAEFDASFLALGALVVQTMCININHAKLMEMFDEVYTVMDELDPPNQIQ